MEVFWMKYFQLDTPSLLVNKERMLENLKTMQDFADKNGVSLRPHTKTHKMPSVALIQEEMGAKGITVAKVEEAEVSSNSWEYFHMTVTLIGPRIRMNA
jgi:D-serine deaminase-like pyridoxal phosphate-dependent protein